jgi:hypothetical protein
MSNNARLRTPAGSSLQVATIARMSSITVGRIWRVAVPKVLLIPASFARRFRLRDTAVRYPRLSDFPCRSTGRNIAPSF